MKKLVIPLAALLALAAAVLAILIYHHAPARTIKASDLMPATTIACVEVPDLGRTQQRWLQTALYALWQEPEIQSFLEQPRTKLQQMQAVSTVLKTIADLKPRQGFFALTALEGNTPRFTAGFSYEGDRGALDALLAEPHARIKQAFPAAKIDLSEYGPAEVQTYTAGDYTLAEAFRGEWYFVADSLPALKAALDRYEGVAAQLSTSLSADSLYQTCCKPLPADPEVTLFVRAGPLVERVMNLVLASGQPVKPADTEELKKIQGLAAATKIDGHDFQDVLYVHAPGRPPVSKIAQNATPLTSPDTLFYYATALPEDFLGSFLDGIMRSQNSTALADFGQWLGDHQSSLPVFLKQFGPEISVIFDWPQAAPPAVGVVSAVRDPAKVRETLEEVLNSDGGWTKTDANGARVYTSDPVGMLPLGPSLALKDQFAVLGFGDQVSLLASRSGATTPKLSASPGFQAATKAIPAAGDLLMYFDTQNVVQRGYTLARMPLSMGLAFNPVTAPYIDASKLPSAETLSKHLGTTALTRSATPEGTLIVSRGPVTIPQVFGALGVGVGAVAYQGISSGKIPLPAGFPGLPSAAPATTPPSAPPGH